MLADAEKAKSKAVTAAEKLDAVRQAKKYRRMVEELSKPDDVEQAQEQTIQAEEPTGNAKETANAQTEEATDDRKFAEQPELNGNHEGMTAIEQADGTHKWVGLQRSEVTEGMSEREIALLDEFGRRMGLPIVAVDIADGRFNGKYADGVVYINVNRDKDWTMRWVAGHELLHDVERLSPEAYNAYKDAVRELFGEEYFEGKVKDTMDVYAEAGQPISREQAEREVVNDFGGDLFSSRDGMKIMQGILDKAGREGKPEFVKRLMEWWDRIKEFFTSSPYYADVQKAMEKAYADAMKNANERLQAEDGKAEMSAKRKRALETVSVSRDEEHPQTVISSTLGAKILNNIDTLAKNYENSISTNEKSFIGEMAKSLGMTDRGKSSQYATFETKNGKLVTIRLSNHNATVSNFDNHGEADGISIVVSPKKSGGITNDGDAHVTEYYYDAIKLRKAEGKPLAEIAKSIKQVLYSGEFKDTTGLAEVQEVNGAELDREPLSAKIESASAEVNTEPTEAQKEAGNYRKGHVKVGKFDISIEQPEGSIRRGTDADGKKWESKMHNTYGYFRGTEGVDGDHIDVFLSNDIDGWNGEKAFVVDQYNPDGTFDEHKVMLGFNDADGAKSDYLANYEKGWEDGRRIDITPIDMTDFEKWIDSSHRKTKPFSEYSSVKKSGDQAEYSVKKKDEEDKAYFDAVKRGDMETAQRMVNEAAERAGYSTNSEYQGTSAFNGAAPYGNDWFVTKEERKQAWDNDEWEGYSSLGDYIDNGVDGGNIEELTNGYSYRSADDMRREAIENLRDVIDNGKKTITMYRSVPASVKEGKFRNGDWVTPSRKYAVDNAEIHGWEDGYRIIKQEVPVDDVWFDGNDIAEFGYGRDKDYANDRDFAYKNTKNNRKLLDAVTYDDNGEVIPLSQRFNPRKADERYSIKSDKKEDRTLAGVHNITEEKLRKALKLGGLANPSVAVIDTSKNGHENFGEISLKLPSDKVAKRTGKNAGTWQGDAWTPTYPQVERKMSNAGAEKLSKDVSSVPNDMYGEVRRGFDRWMDSGEANSAMAYMFLHEKGVAPETKKTQHKFSDEIYNKLRFITAGDFNIYGIGKEDAKKVLEMYIDAKFDGNKDLYEEKTKSWLERNKSIVDAGTKGGLRYTIAKENVELYDEYGFNYKGVQAFVRDVASDHRNGGKLDTDATLKSVDEYIADHNLNDEFNRWVVDKEKQYGVKEVIFDGFTSTGRRRYVDNTIENVSKLMKKQGRNGATGFGFSFNNFAANLMPSFSKLDDIRAKKGLLTDDPKKREEFQDKWGKVFDDLAQKCQPDAKSVFDDYGMGRLTEAAMQKDPQAYLKKEYKVDFSDEDVKRLKEMIKAVKEEYPTMYFETKFERPVYLKEFASAVVPNDLSADVKKAIESSGIALYEYDAKKEGDRSRAFDEAVNNNDDILFSIKREVADTITSDEEANKVIGRMKDNAENIPHIEISDETWKNYIHTPIGRIKMGENQKEKLFTRNRSDQYGMVVRTLESPNVVLEEMDATYDETHERASSYLFVKTFKKGDGSEFTHFENVTVSQDGLEVSISSHIIRENQLRNKLKNDRLLYKATALDTPANVSAEQPANGGSLSSATKVVETFEPKKENGEKKSVEEEISADKANGGGKRPDESIIDYAKRKAEEYSIKKSFGGNSGYVGYSKSKRAVDAENRGLRSVANMDREFAERVREIVSEESGKEAKMTLAEIKRIAKGIQGDEWHHTSKYGNRTQYYSAERIADEFLGRDEYKSEEQKTAEREAEERERKAAEQRKARDKRVRDALITDRDVKTKVEDRGWKHEYTDDAFTSSNGYQIVVNKGSFDEKRTFRNTQFLNNGKVGKRELYLPEWYVDDHIDELQKAMDEYNARLDDALGNEAESVGTIDIDGHQFSIKNQEDNLDAVNKTFNEELQKQIDGTLPKNHIYKMGKPGKVLLSTGVPNLPIQMSAKKLYEKATMFDQDFDLSEVKDLVKELQHPLAVFVYGDKRKAQNVIGSVEKYWGWGFVS